MDDVWRVGYDGVWFVCCGGYLDGVFGCFGYWYCWRGFCFDDDVGDVDCCLILFVYKDFYFK